MITVIPHDGWDDEWADSIKNFQEWKTHSDDIHIKTPGIKKAYT